MPALLETKPVPLVKYWDESQGCSVTLWKSTPERRFQDETAVYWLEYKYWKKFISKEQAWRIWQDKVYRRTQTTPKQVELFPTPDRFCGDRPGMKEVEPNVFIEAS